MRNRCARHLLVLTIASLTLSFGAACERRGGPEAASVASSVPVAMSVVAPPSAPPGPPREVPSATAAEREIDATFRGFEQALPPATTLSEQNGASVSDCEAFGTVTYTRLRGIANRSAPRDDTALPALVRWARHHNACLRVIAIEMLLAKIGHDRNALSAPGMHDPEHHHFHDIMVTLQAYLAKKQIAYDERIFEGLELGLTEKDFAALIRGTWVEANIEHKNFYALIESDGAELRVTSKHTMSDPKTADFTWTTKIKSVTMNDRRQLVVTGMWNIESNNQGYQGKKVEPSQFVYSFWPASPGIVWFKNGEHAYWEKMRKR